MSDQIEVVELTQLEQDDRIDALKLYFAQAVTEESGFTKLPADKQARVREVLKSLGGMRFESRKTFEEVARALLEPVAPDLVKYLGVALDNAAERIGKQRGVLVIYTGGTIGSAPKNPSDPDSPQVVRPWAELKTALPNLGTLGYPIDAISFVEPLDSCNVGPRHWLTLCRIIQENYGDYTGFVILHGTDSMVYSASALAFMLQGLSKPVVLTGSQVAGIVNARNDAHQNVITAIQLANPEAHGLPKVPEVMVAFGNLISRGCRAKKMNVVGYQGFRSPNYPLLGEAGEFITIERKQVRQMPQTELRVLDRLDPNVIVVEVFPGMQGSEILSNILKDKNLRGVVLKSYGAGNIPTDPEFLNLFKEFIANDGVVVNVTSVPQGEVVMGLYETSQVLVDIGIIGGFDITPEAALAKLQVLLGNFDDDIETVKRLMQQSIAGEQRLSLKVTRFPQAGRINQGQPGLGLSRAVLDSIDRVDLIEKVMLRFTEVELNPAGEERAILRIGLEHEGRKDVLGEFRRGRIPERALIKDEGLRESLAIDLTAHKEYFVGRESTGPIPIKQHVAFNVTLSEAPGASFSWQCAELNIYYADA
ncbi:MAG TPA: asparaginase [Candidatus Competibacteraceae bacterium]|nr:asparaginase [Candidatus Competibacteraceae bacterium]